MKYEIWIWNLYGTHDWGYYTRLDYKRDREGTYEEARRLKELFDFVEVRIIGSNNTLEIEKI